MQAAGRRHAGRQFFEARESFKAVLDRVEADADQLDADPLDAGS